MAAYTDFDDTMDFIDIHRTSSFTVDDSSRDSADSSGGHGITLRSHLPPHMRHDGHVPQQRLPPMPEEDEATARDRDRARVLEQASTALRVVASDPLLGGSAGVALSASYSGDEDETGYGFGDGAFLRRRRSAGNHGIGAGNHGGRKPNRVSKEDATGAHVYRSSAVSISPRKRRPSVSRREAPSHLHDSDDASSSSSSSVGLTRSFSRGNPLTGDSGASQYRHRAGSNHSDFSGSFGSNGPLGSGMAAFESPQSAAAVPRPQSTGRGGRPIATDAQHLPHQTPATTGGGGGGGGGGARANRRASAVSLHPHTRPQSTGRGGLPAGVRHSPRSSWSSIGGDSEDGPGSYQSPPAVAIEAVNRRSRKRSNPGDYTPRAFRAAAKARGRTDSEDEERDVVAGLQSGSLERSPAVPYRGRRRSEFAIRRTTEVAAQAHRNRSVRQAATRAAVLRTRGPSDASEDGNRSRVGSLDTSTRSGKSGAGPTTSHGSLASASSLEYEHALEEEMDLLRERLRVAEEEIISKSKIVGRLVEDLTASRDEVHRHQDTAALASERLAEKNALCAAGACHIFAMDSLVYSVDRFRALNGGTASTTSSSS